MPSRPSASTGLVSSVRRVNGPVVVSESAGRGWTPGEAKSSGRLTLNGASAASRLGLQSRITRKLRGCIVPYAFQQRIKRKTHLLLRYMCTYTSLQHPGFRGFWPWTGACRMHVYTNLVHSIYNPNSNGSGHSQDSVLQYEVVRAEICLFPEVATAKVLLIRVPKAFQQPKLRLPVQLLLRLLTAKIKQPSWFWRFRDVCG